jgi:uroporphyrinogen-III decarboxylase
VRTILHTPQGDLTSLVRHDPDIHTDWTLEHFCKSLADLDKYLSVPYEPPSIDMAPVMKAQDKIDSHGLVMINLGDPFGTAASLFKMELSLELAVTEIERMKYLCDVIHERSMFEINEMLKGKVEDVIFNINGPEYATPPYMPPSLFPYYVTPYLARMCHAIRSAGAIPRIHCHGKIGQILDQFMMTEAMMLEPLEPCPDGDINLADVKKKAGGRFCLLGNIEMRELEVSDERRIKSLVREAMDAAKEGSGYILMPTSFPVSVPLPDRTMINYMQMIESACEFGQY